MDDIFLTYVENGNWNVEEFLTAIKKSDCYLPPLTLEDGKIGTFLETEFVINNDANKGASLTHKLKNDNSEETKVWRYQNFNSAGPWARKRATLLAVLRRVNAAASDKKILYESAQAKLGEFKKLGYPCGVRRYACAVMAAEFNELTWRQVRRFQG